VNIDVELGQFRAVIGPNGAGKTTLFNLISGRTTPTAGQVFFRGEDVTSLQSSVRCRRGMSRTFQITSIFPELTVSENVRLAVQLKGGNNFRILGGQRQLMASTQVAHDSLALLGLLDRANNVASTLPHGDQRLLEIAMAVAQEPHLLLLDEPTQGLSPEETDTTVEIIRRIALHFGVIIAEGTADEIQMNPQVQEAYLGVE
jgi:branched-chain amino acid transport system ATP-binding protein